MPARLKLRWSAGPGRCADRRRTLLLPLFAFLLAVTLATPAPCAVLQAAPEAGLPALRVAGTARVDFRTVILTPASREGRMHVTEFVGSRIAAAMENPPFLLFQPVEGVPESVSAQAMTLQDFDRVYTHTGG